MLNQSAQSNITTMPDSEMYSQEIAGQSGDYIEGVMFFIEKGKPNFSGK